MIELPIFFFTDAQQEAIDNHEKLGFGEKPEYNYDEFEIRNVLFTAGMTVVPYKHNDKFPFSKIYSCGEYWICKLSYDEVKSALNNQLNG